MRLSSACALQEQKKATAEAQRNRLSSTSRRNETSRSKKTSQITRQKKTRRAGGTGTSRCWANFQDGHSVQTKKKNRAATSKAGSATVVHKYSWPVGTEEKRWRVFAVNSNIVVIADRGWANATPQRLCRLVLYPQDVFKVPWHKVGRPEQLKWKVDESLTAQKQQLNVRPLRTH